MLTLFAIWAALATLVLALIVTRKFAARHEDDSLHMNQPNVIAQQTHVAHNLEIIDRWGKPLTVLVLVYGLALAAGYLYNAWQASQQIVWK